MPDGSPKPAIPAEATPGVPRRRLTVDEASPPSVFVDPAGMPWVDGPFPGIRSKTLFNDPTTGNCTLLFQLDPGATIPLHEHTAVEQSYVLAGHFVDEEGECLPGQFVWRPAGNTHVAWAGKEGATILGVFLKPNIFASGAKFFTEVAPQD